MQMQPVTVDTAAVLAALLVLMTAFTNLVTAAVLLFAALAFRSGQKP